MSVDQAKQFLGSVASNPTERKKLEKAVADDIVKAGKAAGYSFTEAELEEVMNSAFGGSGGVAQGTSIGWS